ncbi:MAG: hypothetical protein KC417_10035 [Myxococcales bacterium]|nr:hypothetical protein [Myxococcales bacterium]
MATDVWLMGFLSDARAPATELARVFGLQLSIARQLVASAPVCLREGADPQTAERFRRELNGIGAIVELRSPDGVKLSMPPPATSLRPPPGGGGPTSARPPGQANGGSFAGLSTQQLGVLGGTSLRPRAGAHVKRASWDEGRNRWRRRALFRGSLFFFVLALVGGILWVKFGHP